QAAQLPVRDRIPVRDRVPDGDRFLPAAAHGALGSRNRRDRVSRLMFTGGRKPTTQGGRVMSSSDVIEAGFGGEVQQHNGIAANCELPTGPYPSRTSWTRRASCRTRR